MDKHVSNKDVPTNVVRKRKLRKRRKDVAVSRFSDSDSDSYSKSPTVSSEDPDFSLSQAPRSFSEIFAEAQLTLKEHPSTKSEQYNVNVLPELDWIYDEGNPQKSPSKKRKLKSKKDNDGTSEENSIMYMKSQTTSGSFSNFHREKPGTSSSAISKSYLSIADLDTDTELNYDGINASSSALLTRNGITEEFTVISSEEENISQPKLRFTRRQTYDDHPESEDKYPDLVILSSRSPSPGIQVIPSPPAVSSQDVDTQLRIRIRYRNELYEFEGNLTWDVEKLREKLSEATEVPEDELLIYSESDHKMLDGKSLKHYGVKVGDILEALRMSTDRIDVCQEVICLKFQKEGLKRPLLLKVPKYSSLKEIRTRVAKILQEDDKKLFFRIDGDTVDLFKTPDELSLEDDICVDIFMKK